MTRWHALEPADAALLDTAPLRYRFLLRVPASPEAVWRSLTGERSIAAWGPMVSALRWTSPRPFGIGTTREVTLLRSVRVRELFFRWDDGRGYSFGASELGAPLLRRFAEDYAIEPDGTGAVLTWRIAIEPAPAFSLPLRLASPLNRALFGRMAADGRRYYATHSEEA